MKTKRVLPTTYLLIAMLAMIAVHLLFPVAMIIPVPWNLLGIIPLALGVMLMPIVLRTTEDFLRAVPNSMREGGLALGAPKWRVVATVVVPAAFRGIATGMLLAMARIAGETAPLLFTSFGNRFWSRGLSEPTASLPVMIYTYAIAPYDDWHRQAWVAGLVLLSLVLIINIGSRKILARSQ